ncbi:MAG: TonB-dependent receptor domain-containing protein [Spirosomataceae bacterium]
MTKRKLLLGLSLLMCISTFAFGQGNVTISGTIKDKKTKTALAFVSVVLKTEKDNAFIAGTVSNEEGRFSIGGIKSGSYNLEYSSVGYIKNKQAVYVGSLTQFLDFNNLELEEDTQTLKEVSVTAKTEQISEVMDKKTFSLTDNISQSGGSVLQAMQNLSGITVQDGKIQLRGNDKIAVLIDGKQTALTGFGSQTGLDNIPASAIEKVEIINNPSSKYDANGNAGIINIIFKKNKKEGFNGKFGLAGGLGALWVRKENLPTIRPQYTHTPKINPSLALNYRKNKVNYFLQCDYLYTETLNKNEFVVRTYDSGEVINQQLKRNRNTYFITAKTGFDWNIDEQNSLTISGLYGGEKIIDRGDEPFFNKNLTERLRLWQFLEDELKTTAMATANYVHKFKDAGHTLNIGYNYTFHRENEKYFFDNFMPTFTGRDAFKLLSDEQVQDFTVDYQKPLKYGRFESGVKFRKRDIPTNMQFFPDSKNTIIDVKAGGWANYREIIPAVYGNYIYEDKKYEAEIGLRYEYINLKYEVNPDHPTYKSDGYKYSQPFPNVRLAYKINDNQKISAFFNRRVDRPNEVDIRIFPKYDDAEIIKVGNPALRPQFTNSIELGYKAKWDKNTFYTALYHKMAEGTITRISSIVPNSTLIYAIFQNAGKSYNSGVEMVFSKEVSSKFSFNLNLNAYHNQINAFSVLNKYPVQNVFSAEKQEIFSGNVKLNSTLHLSNGIDGQISVAYLAPDIIPQGKINSRFSVDTGLKKSIQSGKGEVFINATDLFNTLVIKREIQGAGFKYTSHDYYETQVIRAGYNYKF